MLRIIYSSIGIEGAYDEREFSIITFLLQLIIFYKSFLSIIFSLLLFIVHQYSMIAFQKNRYKEQKTNLGLVILKNAIEKKKYLMIKNWIIISAKEHEKSKRHKIKIFLNNYYSQIKDFENRLSLLVKVLKDQYLLQEKINEHEFQCYIQHIITTIKEGRKEIIKACNKNIKHFLHRLDKWDLNYNKKIYKFLIYKLGKHPNFNFLYKIIKNEYIRQSVFNNDK